jgi:7-cyano-7-deazaguanine reductase
MSEASRTRPDHQLPTSSLGQRREQPFSYSPHLLEAIPVSSARALPHQQSWVTLAALRFTSLCPVTGQPDWADLTISFIPDAHLVESKSLKEYLTSFRMHGDFHEDVCRIIVDDLASCVRPRYLELSGRFDSRGSIAIWPYVQYARPGDPWANDLLRHRALHYTPGAWAPAPGSVH